MSCLIDSVPILSGIRTVASLITDSVLDLVIYSVTAFAWAAV